MKVDTYPHNRSRVEHAVDTRFGMISHYKTAELQISSHEAL